MILGYGHYILIMGLILIAAWMTPSIVPATVPFGVRVPPDRRNEPIILQAHRDYRIGIALITLVALAGGWLLPILVAISGGVFVILALEMVNYLIAHGRIKRAKEREQWYAGQRQALAADTNPHERVHLSRPWLIANYALLALMLVTAIVRYPALPERVPTHFGLDGAPNQWGSKLSAVVFLPLTALFLTLLLHVLSYVFITMRGRLDPSEPERSRRRAQEQQHLWSDALLALGVVTNLTLFLAALLVWQALPSGSNITALMLLLPTIGLVIILVTAIVQTARVNRQFDVQQSETGYVSRDDDRYWKAGIIYVNRDDPAIFVSKRFGIGMTINFGNPVGILVMLLLIGVPILISIVTAIMATR